MLAGPPDISVAALNRSISQLITQHLPRRYYVHGEYLNVSSSQAGHVYFQLKDSEEDSFINCIIYRSRVQEDYLRIAEGSQVIALGTLGLYPPTGSCQLQVEFILEKGLGQSQLSRQALWRKLASEGLFDPANKRPLPFFPRHVGLISSESGAAVQDFFNVLENHAFAGRVILFPSLVQGPHAAASLEEAIKLANTLPLDVLVLTRGGGASEDLSVFNEESLVRGAATSKAPLISAIGHAIDSTFLDAVADLSLATPTAAAQALVRQQALATRRFRELCLDFEHTARHRIETLASTLQYHATALGTSPKARYARATSRVEHTKRALLSAFTRSLEGHRGRLCLLEQQSRGTCPPYFSSLNQKLGRLKERLEATEVDKALKRGFILAEDEKGQLVESAHSATSLSSFKLSFKDGRVRVKVTEPTKP